VDDASRKPLVALVVLLVIAIPVVVVLLAGTGGDGSSEESAAPRPAGGLRVEPTGGGLSELTVTLEDPSVNLPQTADNAGTVTLECVDQDGQAVLSEPQVWPFGGADDLASGPHVHVRVEPEQFERVARCRLLGTDPQLEGRRF
jgi:hypothetical protein